MMKKALPLLALVMGIGLLGMPGFSQEPDPEDEPQVDEAADAPADEATADEASPEAAESADEAEPAEEAEPADNEAQVAPAAQPAEPAAGRPAGAADGSWSATINAPTGANSLDITIDGSAGRWSSAAMGDGAVQVAGNAVSWSVDVTVPVPITIRCQATIQGDTMTGDCNLGSLGNASLYGSRR